MQESRFTESRDKFAPRNSFTGADIRLPRSGRAHRLVPLALCIAAIAVIQRGSSDHPAESEDRVDAVSRSLDVGDEPSPLAVIVPVEDTPRSEVPQQGVSEIISSAPEQEDSLVDKFSPELVRAQLYQQFKVLDEGEIRRRVSECYSGSEAYANCVSLIAQERFQFKLEIAEILSEDPRYKKEMDQYIQSIVHEGFASEGSNDHGELALISLDGELQEILMATLGPEITLRAALIRGNDPQAIAIIDKNLSDETPPHLRMLAVKGVVNNPAHLKYTSIRGELSTELEFSRDLGMAAMANPEIGVLLAASEGVGSDVAREIAEYNVTHPVTDSIQVNIADPLLRESWEKRANMDSLFAWSQALVGETGEIKNPELLKLLQSIVAGRDDADFGSQFRAEAAVILGDRDYLAKFVSENSGSHDSEIIRLVNRALLRLAQF